MTSRIRRRSPAGRLDRGSADRGRHDRGTASIEFSVLLPLLLFGGMVALQAGAVMWTAVSTSEAARQAARAAMFDGYNPSRVRAVADDSLPDPLQVTGYRRSGHTVELDVQAPQVLPGFSFTITRKAEMP